MRSYVTYDRPGRLDQWRAERVEFAALNAPMPLSSSARVMRSRRRQTGYHGQITAASFSSGPGPKDAPPITGNGGPAPQDSQTWKSGDKRHRPYIAWHGGMGPPSYPDSPPWIEVGPYSGHWVRSDELPGVKVLPPGSLGPPMVADEHGSRDPYIELGPNTGVWVPKSDLPGALIIPPGSSELPPYGYDEYIPGSGIYLWHGDLIPEPYNPTGPLLPPQTSPAGR